MLESSIGTSVIGGVLIGVAATYLMLTLGRVAGVSGIVGGLLPPIDRSHLAWRLAFVAGLLVAPFAYGLFATSAVTSTPAATWPVAVLGGLCVGVGTVIGSGCTSGHGVCGLARLSTRSLAAVLTFMAVAAGTVFVSRHLIGVSP